MRITEKYRPKTLSEVVGQNKATQIAQSFIDRELVGGHAFWISGATGVGKTTIARILAASIADELFVTEVVGREVSGAFLAALERDFRLLAFGRGGRVVIVNESQGLGRAAIERLLDLLESLPSHCAVIFTTTRDGQERLFEDQDDAGPLLSRCVRINLTNQGLAKAAAPMLQRIAQAEGLDGQPVEAYSKLMARCANSIRAAVQAIENGEMLVERTA